MTFRVRGLIEGFYGRRWTFEERHRVVSTIGPAGFTTYVYAPKEDPLQNDGWRTPYPPEDEAQLAGLARACADVGMELWIGLRPVGISYVDDRDLDRVVAKLDRYLALQASRVVLLADDIPSVLDERAGARFRRLADAHAWLVEGVLVRLGLPPDRLVFVPTDYHGTGTPYLEHLGATLPTGIDVCWTGSGVFAPTITVEEANRIGRVLRRAPLVWDNYPVNDEHDRHDLRIGPIRGREAGLDRATAGFLVNPALEPEISLVPLLTWAEYLRDPAAYDPHDAWQRALRSVAGHDDDARVVATIAAGLDRSILDQGWKRPPEAVLDAAAARLPDFRNRTLAAELESFLIAPRQN